MKKLILPFLLLGFVSTALTPQLVRFEWDYSGDAGSADYFILRSSDNVTTPLTNWGVVTTIPAVVGGVWVTNYSTPVLPGLHFFYMTASNSFWALESGPSNITNTPPLPELPSKVKIRKP